MSTPSPVCLVLAGLALGCASDAPTEGSNDLVFTDPMSLDMKVCAQSQYVEIRDYCHLDFAVRVAITREVNSGAGGTTVVQDARRAGETWAACGAIQSELWRDECHFLVAEQLADNGYVTQAIDHCVTSGSFAWNCLAHAVWSRRPFSQDVVASDAGAAEGIGKLLEQIAEDSRNTEPPEFQLGLDMMRASAWFELYYGSGLADPAAARTASERDRLDGRTAFAWEAVRLQAAGLSMTDRIAQVLAVWEGRSPPVRGESMIHRCWQGRNSGRRDLQQRRRSIKDEGPAPTITTGEESLLSQLSRGLLAHTPHYGLRLAGESEEEDLVIATMEAAYFDLRSSKGAYVPFMKDPRPRVQWTAVRLERKLRQDAAPALPAIGGGPSPRVSKWKAAPRRVGTARVWSADLNREGCK